MNRYIVDNPHKNYIAVVDREAPPGAQIICYNKSLGYQLTVKKAKQIAKEFNQRWEAKRDAQKLIVGEFKQQLQLF
jgi:hypothetical protein